MAEKDIHTQIVEHHAEAVVKAGLGEVRNGILYLTGNTMQAMEIYREQPPLHIPPQREIYDDSADSAAGSVD